MPDGRLKALSRTYATVRWDPEGVVAFGEHVAELCATLLHNLNFPDRSYAVRRVLNVRLDPRYVPMLRRDLEQQVAVLADSVDHTLNDPAHSVRGKETPPETAALGLTLFVFEPKTTEETASENEERAAVSGRPRVRVRGLKERDAGRGKF
jgi:DNA-binding IclR family transcriptional regulator